ncbi:MAG: hypothetical protein JXA41_14190 [Deltaproteobacteria bacterium]|nr:hypothetical protein [Deltaproteobacteria bacterium]
MTKPIILVTLVASPTEIVSEALERIKETGVAILKNPLFAGQAMSNLAWYADKVKRSPAGRGNRRSFIRKQRRLICSKHRMP